MSYADTLKVLLSPAERRVLQKLSTPQKIQDFLDSFPINFPEAGEHIYSPRLVLQKKKMYCIEGAVLAAASLAYHDQPPLLLDFQSTEEDEDHVLALFKERGLWGAMSKTNHPVLRWRDPLYRSVRELAMSYFHEYFMWHKKDGKLLGKKTLRAYSKPFNLRRYPPSKWWGTKDIDWLAEALDTSPHSPIIPPGMQKFIRNASAIETRAMELTEWKKPKR